MTDNDLPSDGTLPTGPIFIGGARRSGTTLMRALLDAHPRICCGPEFLVIPEISGLYRMISTYLPIHQVFANTQADIALNFRQFVDGLMSNFRRTTGKARWAEKTPHNVLNMLTMGEIFPEARFIQMIRDGRDVACSLVTMHWVSITTGRRFDCCHSIRNAARYWREIVLAGRQQAAHPSLAGRVLTVRYEQLVAEPEEMMRQILQFVGENWDPAVMAYWQKDRTREPTESSSAQIARPVYKSAVSRWQKDMTQADKDVFETEAGDLLRELGYAQEGWNRAEAAAAVVAHA